MLDLLLACVTHLLLNILSHLLQTAEDLELTWRSLRKTTGDKELENVMEECFKSKLKNCCSVKNSEETVKENYSADLPNLYVLDCTF